MPNLRMLPLAVCLVTLGGCAVQTYYPPSMPASEPIAQSGGQPVGTTGVTVNVPYDMAWQNLQNFVRDRYRVVSSNRSTGTLELTIDAPDPDSFINCGMVRVQQGYFDTNTEFLDYLTQRTPVDLDVTLHVKLTAISSRETKVHVNGDYALAVNYQTNPSTGAIIGGQMYRFDSKGGSNVVAPGSGLSGECQSTGEAEQAIMTAAGSPS